MGCIICDKPLTGRQTKFCSSACKNAGLQSYEAQQARGLRRKVEAIKGKGGACMVCGYARNYAALCFHHRDESTKSFPLTAREFANNRAESLAAEVEKCDLLCHNCHMEHHWPGLAA